MKYSDTGFRAVYRRFCTFPLTDRLRAAMEGFPKVNDGATCVLTYGYVDQEKGLTMEIIAVGQEGKKGVRFADGRDDISSKIRIEEVMDEDFAIISDEEGSLMQRFAKKIDMLRHYDASEEVEKSRTFGFLDASRHNVCIDDVLVYLTRNGREPEGCWVRITGLGDHFFVGTLLNEPKQDFGYHIGERISFFVRETDDKNVICFADMTPDKELTAEDLEDGSMLKEAIHAFNEDRSEGNLIEILQILRDSYVTIPCNMIMSDEDRAMMDEAVMGALESGDLESLAGQTFQTQDSIRMIPDILQNGDDYFFPVFSSSDEMGEYGEHFSTIGNHFLEVINLARNNEKDLAGIVVNAFTEPFVLNRDLFEVVEKMKTRLISQDTER